MQFRYIFHVIEYIYMRISHIQHIYIETGMLIFTLTGYLFHAITVVEYGTS